MGDFSNFVENLTTGQMITYSVLLVLAFLFLRTLRKSIVKVSETESVVVERLGKRGRTLKAGYHFIIPFIEEEMKPRISTQEQPVSIPTLDVITADNAILKVEAGVFFRVVDASKAVYQTAWENMGASLTATASGIIRSELGRYEFDQVQTNRSELNESVKVALENDLKDWGVIITRVEILSVDVDEATREVMLQQLNAERSRRAVVTEAEGKKRATELQADAALYEAQKLAEANYAKAEQAAKARRIEAEAEAYATETMAGAIKENGLDAAQYYVALKQVETLAKVGDGDGKQVVILSSDFIDSFGNAFKSLTGGKR